MKNLKNLLKESINESENEDLDEEIEVPQLSGGFQGAPVRRIDDQRRFYFVVFFRVRNRFYKYEYLHKFLELLECC